MRREAHGSSPRGGPCVGTRPGPANTATEEVRGVVARSPHPLRLPSFRSTPHTTPSSSARSVSRSETPGPKGLPNATPRPRAHMPRNLVGTASPPPASEEESTAAGCPPPHVWQPLPHYRNPPVVAL